MGYERVDQVERCGHFSVRGDIIDIFPINKEHPLRIEFFDDEIDGMRWFNEDTQRSIRMADKAIIFPISYEGKETAILSDYLKDGLLILDEPLHGLDTYNRRRVKKVIEAFCRRKDKTMIMVTHYESELPNTITDRIFLKRNR